MGLNRSPVLRTQEVVVFVFVPGSWGRAIFPRYLALSGLYGLLRLKLTAAIIGGYNYLSSSVLERPMVIKENTQPEPAGKLEKAGWLAEQNMAFYLKRAFGERDDVWVFNDLRLVRNGEVAQIDHLVLHRYGLVLVESKSACCQLEVNKQLEFTRVYGRKRFGVASPIRQVERQRFLLQSLLNDHKDRLRGKTIVGEQHDFPDRRFRVLVAISDSGDIRRKGCEPPELMKADQVSEVISGWVAEQDDLKGLGGFIRYAFADSETQQERVDKEIPRLKPEELAAIKDFLLAQHTEREPAPEQPQQEPQPPQTIQTPPQPAAPAQHTCRHCQSTQLTIKHGYNHYLKCQTCQRNTPLQTNCQLCGQPEQIIKQNHNHLRQYQPCGTAIPIAL